MRLTNFFCLILCATLHAEYFIAIKKNEGNVWDSLNCYTSLRAPNGRFYADPFLFKYQGVNYLFFENYDSQKGVISYVEIDREGNLSDVKLALERPIHLSFPYVFQEGDDIYMLPETYQNRSVSLFKCKEFPNQWEQVRVLVHGEHFSDSILFQHNHFYWLFTAIHKDRLCIYYSESLEGKFRPHPINRKHIRGRNAGSVFSINGKLVRPTMDCQERYGRAVIFKEILLLTPKEFQEQEIGSIEPDWAPDLVGTHAFCLTEDYLVYDGNLKEKIENRPKESRKSTNP